MVYVLNGYYLSDKIRYPGDYYFSLMKKLYNDSPFEPDTTYKGFYKFIQFRYSFLLEYLKYQC